MDTTRSNGTKANTHKPQATSAAMYGGQAVIEGVMMRGVKYFAVACRRSNGTIALTCELVPKVLRPNWQKWPFLRGAFALVDSMALGTKSLFWAAKIAEADIAETAVPVSPNATPTAEPASPSNTSGASRVNDMALGGAIIFSLGMGIFLFKILPLLGLEALQLRLGWQPWQATLVDMLVRVTIFMGYIALVSRLRYVHRVFQYHGAEHKAINALEAGQELTVPNARQASRLHPRCGTAFVLIVVTLSALVMTPFRALPLEMKVLIQLAFILPVAGISFEMLRLAGKFRNNPIANALSQPGMWMQYLTTREPDDSQLEVSIASLKAVMQAEQEEATTGTSKAEEASAAAVA